MILLFWFFPDEKNFNQSQKVKKVNPMNDRWIFRDPI